MSISLPRASSRLAGGSNPWYTSRNSVLNPLIIGYARAEITTASCHANLCFLTGTKTYGYAIAEQSRISLARESGEKTPVGTE